MGTDKVQENGRHKSRRDGGQQASDDSQALKSKIKELREENVQ